MKTDIDLILFYIFILIFFLINFLGINFMDRYISSDYGNILILLLFCIVIGIYGNKVINNFKDSIYKIKHFNDTLSVIFIFIIILIGVYVSIKQPIFNYDIRYFSLVNDYLFYVGKFKNFFILLAITIGWLLIKLNHNKIQNINNSIQIENDNIVYKSEIFNKRYTKISQIPLIGKLIRYYYIDPNKIYATAIIIIYGTINLYFIDKFNVLPDETFHYFSAKGISEYGIPNIQNNLLYLRGILVSYFNYFASFLNLSAEITLRLPSLIVSLLVLLTISNSKTLNGKTKIISILLLIINLFFIQNSLYARFYIYQILINLLFFFTLIQIEKKSELMFKDHLYLSFFPLISIFISELYIYLYGCYGLFLLIKLKWNVFKVKHFFWGLFVTIMVGIKLIFIKDIILLNDFLQNLSPTGVATTESNFIMYVLNELSINTYFLNLFFNELAFVFIFCILGSIILFQKYKASMIFIYIYLFLISITTIKNQPYTLAFFIGNYVLLAGIGVYYLYKIIGSRIILFISLLGFGFVQAMDYYSNLKVGGIPPALIYISPAIRILNDYKSVSEYVNNTKFDPNNTLILSSYGISLPHQIYLKYKINFMLGGYYKMFRMDSETNEHYEIFTKLKSINTLWDLQDLNRINNLIIITSYTSTNQFRNINGTVIKHIPQELIIFLESNQDKVKYIGKDKVSKVYIFEKGTISGILPN